MLSSRTLTLERFKSRWTHSRSCAASRASAICAATPSVSATAGVRPAGTVGRCDGVHRRATGDALGERWNWNELDHQRPDIFGVFESVNLCDVRIIE